MMRVTEFLWLTGFVLVAELTVITATQNRTLVDVYSGNEKILKRRRRYLAFPDGSSVSASICLTIGMVGNPHVDYISWAENWGVAYDLPNYTWAKQNLHGFNNTLNSTESTAQRRSRRDLYGKIETIVESMGFNGHACIARALCESAKHLDHLRRRRRGNMIEEIVKTIFSLPSDLVNPHEAEIIHTYDRIYRRSRRYVSDCKMEYSGCPFSIVELALGKFLVKSNFKQSVMPKGFSFM